MARGTDCFPLVLELSCLLRRARLFKAFWTLVLGGYSGTAAVLGFSDCLWPVMAKKRFILSMSSWSLRIFTVGAAAVPASFSDVCWLEKLFCALLY